MSGLIAFLELFILVSCGDKFNYVLGNDTQGHPAEFLSNHEACIVARWVQMPNTVRSKGHRFNSYQIHGKLLDRVRDVLRLQLASQRGQHRRTMRWSKTVIENGIFRMNMVWKIPCHVCTATGVHIRMSGPETPGSWPLPSEV